MNLFNKILAGVIFNFSNGSPAILSGLFFFIGRLALTAPLALLGLVIISIFEAMDTGTRIDLPENRIFSFFFLMLFYPIVHALSRKNDEILNFIEQSEECSLKKYYWYYVFILITSGSLFVATVLIFKN